MTYNNYEENQESKYYSECPRCGSTYLEYDHTQISDTVFKTTVYCNNCDFTEDFPEEEYDYEEDSEISCSTTDDGTVNSFV